MAAESRGRSLAQAKLVLVRGARQLITLRGAPSVRRGAELSELAIIPDGAVLIRDGVIEEVGPTRRIERLKAARDAAEVDATGSIVLPAFIDSGTRPVFSHTMDASFQSGIASFAEAKRNVLEESAAALLANMARHGTLTAEVLTGYGGDSAGELRLMRLHVSLQGRVINLSTSLVLSGYVAETFSGSALEWTRMVMVPLLASASRLRLVQSATVTLGNEGAGLDEAREFLWAARSAGVPAKVQTGPECSQAAAALTLASDAHVVHGLEGPLPTLCAALAQSSAILTLTPAVSFAQGREDFAPARELIDRGAAVALGTNFSLETNSNYNMLHTMELACRYTGMSLEEAVTAATINAAHALGCSQDCGSIEPGKRADLVVYDCPNYADLLRNPAIHQVSRVLRSGQTVYRRGRVEELE